MDDFTGNQCICRFLTLLQCVEQHHPSSEIICYGIHVREIPTSSSSLPNPEGKKHVACRIPPPTSRASGPSLFHGPPRLNGPRVNHVSHTTPLQRGAPVTTTLQSPMLYQGNSEVVKLLGKSSHMSTTCLFRMQKLCYLIMYMYNYVCIYIYIYAGLVLENKSNQ